MSTVISTPTPKHRFQESKDNISKHRDLVASKEFERAVDFALLQYQAQLATSVNPDFNGMAAMGLKILGVQEFVRTFRMLSESPTAPEQRVEGNLDHTK